MERSRKKQAEVMPEVSEAPSPMSQTSGGDGNPSEESNGEQTQVPYADKKGAAWKRLMAQRFPKAMKALDRLITLGTWTNYHYTQEEVKRVCDKLRAQIKRIETAHQRTESAPESPLALPWED